MNQTLKEAAKEVKTEREKVFKIFRKPAKDWREPIYRRVYELKCRR